ASLRGQGLLLIVTILVIYIVLGILYESFIHPLTILSGLPSAGAGALLTLLLFRAELNLYGFVGIIVLVGIVEKNAIMMIDFALEAQRDGKSPATAIYEGCLLRFRPIMMTTMAALLGTLPIALGFGAGADARRPLGLAVVGGLLVSQLLTLYITPVLYIYMESLQARLAAARPGWGSRIRRPRPDAGGVPDYEAGFIGSWSGFSVTRGSLRKPPPSPGPALWPARPGQAGVPRGRDGVGPQRRCSKAWAARSTVPSSHCRPISIMPTGRPSDIPQG